MDDIFSSQLRRRESHGLLRRLTIRPNDMVDFSSNNYLSLSQNSEVQRDYFALLNWAKEYGDGGSRFSLGSGGSRLLDGNTAFAESLEQLLADFHGSAAGLLFNSGYEANSGLLSSVPQQGDVVVYDELIHASVHSGIKLSRAAQSVAFRHNCIWHDRAEPQPGGHGQKTLEEILRQVAEGDQGRQVREGRRHVFVAVEAVYSMDGDVAPLKDIADCVEQILPLGNGHVIVDEAHSNGVLGDRGRGLVCHLELESRVWARVCTFGKAIGCSGAIVLCSPTTREYLINYARTFIYTTAMAFPSLAAIQVAYNYISSGRADASRRELSALIKHTSASLTALCLRLDPLGAIIKVAQPKAFETPIIPIFTPHARALAEHCQGRGYLVRAIVSPTVPHGTDRLRLCLHAKNTVDECDGLCRAIEEWICVETMATTKALDGNIGSQNRRIHGHRL